MKATSESAPAEFGWMKDFGSEEAELLNRLPESPRMRRLVQDLEVVMMREGFLHLSTDDVARRLRCSKATLYRLAPSREELFELVIARWLARMRDSAFREITAAPTWPERLVAHLEVVKSATHDASQRFMQDLTDFPGGYRLLDDHQQRRIEVLETILARGVEDGSFRELHPRLAAELILATLRRVVDPDFLASVGLSLAEAAEEWFRILEYGLLQPSKRRPAGSRS